MDPQSAGGAAQWAQQWAQSQVSVMLYVVFTKAIDFKSTPGYWVHMCSHRSHRVGGMDRRGRNIFRTLRMDALRINTHRGSNSGLFFGQFYGGQMRLVHSLRSIEFFTSRKAGQHVLQVQ